MPDCQSLLLPQNDSDKAIPTMTDFPQCLFIRLLLKNINNVQIDDKLQGGDHSQASFF